jgi:mono/diheme cytochrome c family protein
MTYSILKRFAMTALSVILAIRCAHAEDTAVYFEDSVRPIFKAMCFQCHGEEDDHHGGLDVRLVRLMRQGGDSGESIVPGNAKQSRLWQRIEADEMPEGSKKLSAKQKQIVRDWIEQGAQTKRPEPDNVGDVRYTPEELAFWSFQPITKPAIPSPNDPTPANPIDAFVLEKLQSIGLGLSPATDRATSIRRLKLDLHGLPPSPAEVDEFLADDTPDAYEKVVDRLLESPQFGVRWARHWLDVAGYSETDGNQNKDQERKHAWRYRDYVIGAINSDKPYNQFLVEQLAGEELIDGQPDPENDRHVELLSATGLLRMAPDVTATENTLMDRNQAVADVIKVVSSSVLGLSVGCAQCHDHRYDPISIDDYYRFRAIFDPAFPLEHWLQPEQRLVDLTTAVDNAKGEEIEAQAKQMEADLKTRKQEVGKKIFDIRLAEVPESNRDTVREAIETPEDKRTDTQKQLLHDHPMVRSVAAIIDQLVEFDKVFESKNYRQFQQDEKDIAKFRQTKPMRRMIMCVCDRVEHVPESAVFMRGDPMQRKYSVKPGELYVLSRQRNLNELPLAPAENPKTVGRRLAYAKQITDGTHPLVARVVINRMWQHHFGRGLVATPNDFGAFGGRPSHPELLNWLSADLIDNGWSLKRLHKMMVMSHTYRQRSTRSDQTNTADPDNQSFSRANLQRMDAETIRDSMLFVTGTLNIEIGGPSVPVSEDGEGRAMIGRRLLNDGLYAGMEDVGAQKFRRSIFLQSKRTLPLSMLEAFDMPVMNPNCDARRCSTVAPQSLMFLNDQSIVELSDKLCDRVWEEFPNPDARIGSLFKRLFAVDATPREQERCREYLALQRATFAADPNPEWQKHIAKWDHAPDMRALASLCQALMASNRFLYMD